MCLIRLRLRVREDRRDSLRLDVVNVFVFDGFLPRLVLNVLMIGSTRILRARLVFGEIRLVLFACLIGLDRELFLRSTVGILLCDVSVFPLIVGPGKILRLG